MNLTDLMHARYAEGGRGPDAYDCFGFFCELCRRRGQTVPDEITPAGVQACEAAILGAISGGWVRLARPAPGCAVALRIGRYVTHLGMVLEDGVSFLHMSDNAGPCLARIDDLRWKRRIEGFYAQR